MHSLVFTSKNKSMASFLIERHIYLLETIKNQFCIILSYILQTFVVYICAYICIYIYVGLYIYVHNICMFIKVMLFPLRSYLVTAFF